MQGPQPILRLKAAIDDTQPGKWNVSDLLKGGMMTTSNPHNASTMRLSTIRYFFLLVFAVLASANFRSPLVAATYYVDFVGGSDANAGTSKAAPWKRIKGMANCTGVCSTTTLKAGDSVIFKGGTTWTGSYPWTFSGGATGNHVTYTTDQTWFTGASFAQPVFDDAAAHPGAVGMANASGTGYITLNDLKFVNCGSPQVANSDKCLVFTDTHDITITKSTFSTEAWISLYFVFTSSGSYGSFVFTENDWSRTSGAIWMASAAPNTNIHYITYNNNTFHDFASQIGGGVHGDGAFHWFQVPAGDPTQYGDNMTFCGNRFYGDFRRSFGSDGAMTGYFFAEGGLSAVICNNDMSASPVQANMFDGLIVLEGEGSSKSSGIQIYNNSMVTVGVNPMSAAVHISGGYKNITMKNNIVSGMKYPVYLEDPAGSGATFVSDYNLWHGMSGQLVWGSAFQSYATWKAGGRDAHSLMGVDPSWVSAPADQRLKSNSPAIQAGVNLSSLGIPALNLDLAKSTRSASGSWDIGAFQYGVVVTAVDPPASLTATVN